MIQKKISNLQQYQLCKIFNQFRFCQRFVREENWKRLRTRLRLEFTENQEYGGDESLVIGACSSRFVNQQTFLFEL